MRQQERFKNETRGCDGVDPTCKICFVQPVRSTPNALHLADTDKPPVTANPAQSGLRVGSGQINPAGDPGDPIVSARLFLQPLRLSLARRDLNGDDFSDRRAFDRARKFLRQEIAINLSAVVVQPPASERCHREADGGHVHPHPLYAARYSEFRRDPVGHVRARYRPCHVHLHRVRSQRSGPRHGQTSYQQSCWIVLFENFGLTVCTLTGQPNRFCIRFGRGDDTIQEARSGRWCGRGRRSDRLIYRVLFVLKSLWLFVLHRIAVG